MHGGLFTIIHGLSHFHRICFFLLGGVPRLVVVLAHPLDDGLTLIVRLIFLKFIGYKDHLSAFQIRTVVLLLCCLLALGMPYYILVLANWSTRSLILIVVVIFKLRLPIIEAILQFVQVVDHLS